MTRDERRRRWIELLEANPNAKYRSLHEIELLSPSQRRDCRADNSPLSLAFADPVLRSAGLPSERVGHCTDFFELSDEQMHRERRCTHAVQAPSDMPADMPGLVGATVQLDGTIFQVCGFVPRMPSSPILQGEAIELLVRSATARST